MIRFKVGEVVQQGFSTDTKYEVIRVIKLTRTSEILYEVIRIPAFTDQPRVFRQDALNPWGTTSA
jgi:hypothetical protein